MFRWLINTATPKYWWDHMHWLLWLLTTVHICHISVLHLKYRAYPRNFYSLMSCQLKLCEPDSESSSFVLQLKRHSDNSQPYDFGCNGPNDSVAWSGWAFNHSWFYGSQFKTEAVLETVDSYALVPQQLYYFKTCTDAKYKRERESNIWFL